MKTDRWQIERSTEPLFSTNCCWIFIEPGLFMGTAGPIKGSVLDGRLRAIWRTERFWLHAADRRDVRLMPLPTS